MVDNQLPLLKILRITLLLELTLAFITPIIIPNDHTHNNNYNNNKFFKKKTFVLKNATPSPDIAATATTAKAKTNSKKYNQQLGEFERLNIITKTDNGGVGETTMNSRIVKLHDFSSLDPIHYQTMWDIQKEIVDGHVERLKVEFKKEEPKSQFWLKEDIVINDDTDTDTDTDTNSNDIEDQSQDQQMQQQQQFVNKNHRKKGCDTVIILQHEPVYTLGTASDTNFIKSVGDGIDVIRIERGGEVTYHGPGQLTVYPILDLRGYKQDIHWYMRALEEAILLALHRAGVSEVSL
jgi:lipoate-protein ligase A